MALFHCPGGWNGWEIMLILYGAFFSQRVKREREREGGSTKRRSHDKYQYNNPFLQAEFVEAFMLCGNAIINFLSSGIFKDCPFFFIIGL